jgi:ABC-type nickel/cobalt efflux system permease component RcnA
LAPNGGHRVSLRARVTATLAAGVAAGLVAGVPTGAIVAVVVLVALARPRARVALGVASAALVALAGLYTAVQQFRYDYLPQFEWPTRFHRAHVIAWLAVCLLAADALVEIVRHRGDDNPPVL